MSSTRVWSLFHRLSGLDSSCLDHGLDGLTVNTKLGNSGLLELGAPTVLTYLLELDEVVVGLALDNVHDPPHGLGHEASQVRMIGNVLVSSLVEEAVETTLLLLGEGLGPTKEQRVFGVVLLHIHKVDLCSFQGVQRSMKLGCSRKLHLEGRGDEYQRLEAHPCLDRRH